MDYKEVLTVILAGGKGERLEPLTKHRTKPAVPFGGIYRIIDFTLSNCINSDLRRILILIQYKCLSLTRHVREGWNFLPSSMNEYIEPIPPQQRIGTDWYKGTADSIYQNIYSIERQNPKYVLILAGDHIYKMDYKKLLDFHVRRKSDVTIGVVEVPMTNASQYGILSLDEEGKVLKFQEKPANPFHLPGRPDTACASMGIYVFNTNVLFKSLEEDAYNENSSHDFGKNLIPKLCQSHRVHGYNFTLEDTSFSGYWRDVGTIESYYDANMDLVSVSPQFNMYDPSWPIYTLQKHLPPPKFVFAQEHPGGRLGIALDSIISNGCVISGGRVQNSILSTNVRVNSYSSVSQSILFEGVQIGRHAKVRRAIIDKNVVIPENMEIGFNPEEDRKRFIVSDTGIVLIPKGEVVKI